MTESAAAMAAIPGLPPEASARLLALLSAEPAVQEVWLYGFPRHGVPSMICCCPGASTCRCSMSCPNPWLSTWRGWGGWRPIERRRREVCARKLTRLGEYLTITPPVNIV